VRTHENRTVHGLPPTGAFVINFFLLISNTTPDQKETSSGLFKKLASKLRYPNTGQLSPTSTPAKVTSKVRVKNDFTSKEQREAALRECGLIATPRKDLSQVEQDLDRRFTKTESSPRPQDQTMEAGGQPSAAEKIMREWKAKNQAGRL
jgi:hypothetical protein